MTIPPVTTPPVTTPPASNPPSANGEPANLGQVAAALTHDAQYYSTVVTSTYEQVLSRAPDASGLGYWVTQMQAGLTGEQFAADLLSSSEYASLHGNSDLSWVLGLYTDVLGRTADSAGLNYWLGQLQSGESRYQVALTIINSPEYEGSVVANDYQTFLGRAASAADIAYWVNAFEQGASNEDVIAGFISSPEYFSGATKGQSSATAWVDSVFNDLYQTTPSASDLAYWVAQLT
jgi:hypothetical protein